MKNKKLLNLVLLALFAGLIFLMGQTPLGLIPLGICIVTRLVIPVAVGTSYMGWKSGLVLGATFAATSLVSALIKPSALVGTLMSASPLLAVVMTVLPRLCIPLVITGVCLVMMFLSRRTIYPWLISIFSLVLPWLIWITNVFPA